MSARREPGGLVGGIGACSSHTRIVRTST